MRFLTIILLLFSLSGFSQSVHIDGPTGQVGDLAEITAPDSADWVIVERGDSSKKIMFHYFRDHSAGQTYISTAGEMTIGTGGTFERLFEGAMAYTPMHLEHFTHSDGRLTYVGEQTRDFLVVVSITIESGEVAQLVQIRIAEGGTPIAGSNQQANFSAVSSDTPIPLNWIVKLATNEYIEVFGTSDQNGDQFTVHNLTMTVTGYN